MNMSHSYTNNNENAHKGSIRMRNSSSGHPGSLLLHLVMFLIDIVARVAHVVEKILFPNIHVGQLSTQGAGHTLHGADGHCIVNRACHVVCFYCGAAVGLFEAAFNVLPLPSVK